ncbi:MAG: recombination protein RecR, partial [Spirochaetales bacterium]|nr:recombination protein RecR [Candidatus Physcosoma equi]
MGEKSALRLAYHLINAREADNRALAEAIATIKEKIHPCPVCGCYTEGAGCQYCDDEKRDKSQLCIVEQPQDVIT